MQSLRWSIFFGARTIVNTKLKEYFKWGSADKRGLKIYGYNGSVETGMTGSSYPCHENCEGTAGIRNWLLRSFGRSFQVIEAPRGAPTADQFLKCLAVITALPRLPRRGPEAGSPHKITRYNDFHGSGVNSRSCTFQQKRYNHNIGDTQSTTVVHS